eukprot:scaffold209633_cov23-Prasinocladus_malaysianus.AAC.1
MTVSTQPTGATTSAASGGRAAAGRSRAPTAEFVGPGESKLATLLILQGCVGGCRRRGRGRPGPFATAPRHAKQPLMLHHRRPVVVVVVDVVDDDGVVSTASRGCLANPAPQ